MHGCHIWLRRIWKRLDTWMNTLQYVYTQQLCWKLNSRKPAFKSYIYIRIHIHRTYLHVSVSMWACVTLNGVVGLIPSTKSDFVLYANGQTLSVYYSVCAMIKTLDHNVPFSVPWTRFLPNTSARAGIFLHYVLRSFSKFILTENIFFFSIFNSFKL